VPAGHHRKPKPPAARLRRLRTPAGFALAFGIALAPAVPIAASTGQPTADAPAAVAVLGTQRGVRTETQAASRSMDRLSLPVPRPVKALALPAQPRLAWTTTRLNVWSGPGEGSSLLTVLDAAAKVRGTGTVRGAWAQIEWQHRRAWVRTAYLAHAKPKTTTADETFGTVKPSDGPRGAPCPDGSGVEVGLQPNTVKLYRAVCAAFPAVTTWGGRSGSGGDHGAGKALDIMSTGALRDSIATWVREHASEFGVSVVIRAQHIWTVQRSSEGWRLMPDRGSPTANHFDHVHVSVY
jgi:hypothetical protein